MALGITTYSIALALHIMAVVAAFGLPLAYPLLLPYARSRHPRSMPGVHDVQHHLNQRITAPGTVLILLLGIYMATKEHLWDEPWVLVPLAILVVIGGLGGGVVVPATAQLTELARADVDAAGTGDVRWSAEYERVYAKYMRAEILLGVLVLVAIFFMAAKPFS
jgi:uncharacterized membrane protein